MDDQGNALAVWTYRDFFAPSDRNFTSQVFFSKRFASSGTWSTPQVLQSDPLGFARDIRIAVEPSGLAWAVWTERTFKDTFFSSNDQYAVFAAKFDPANGWSTPEKVTGDVKWRIAARIATDRHGNPRVIVAWNSGIPLESTLYAARRSAVGVWGLLETLAFAVPVGGLAPDFSEYDLAVDANDDAIAIWREWDGTRYLVRSRHYTVAGGWEATLDLQLASPDSGFGPQLAMDDAGNAFVAWHEFDGASYAIWTARFEKGNGWTILELISSLAEHVGDDSTFPKIAFDASGNAVAIWTKFDFTLNQTLVRANYYSKTAGWRLDETLSSGPGISWRPELAMSRTGYAIATWWQEVNNLFQAWSASRAPTP